MEQRYKSEVAKMVAYGMNWIAKDELPKREVKRTGKLSKNEILEVIKRDCARGADGMLVIHSGPTRIPKKIKL